VRLDLNCCHVKTTQRQWVEDGEEEQQIKGDLKDKGLEADALPENEKRVASGRE
jgi:hypothetical protein